MKEYGIEAEEFQSLLCSLEEMPARVRGLVEGLSEDERVRKPAPEEFSATENVCHLRDIEEEGYSVRIRRLINETEPHLADLDGARLARERDYNSQSMWEALQSFTRARSQNVVALRQLPPESLQRGGTFEGAGRITLCQLLFMMQEHDAGHITELERLARVATRD
jgi:hypothetical protein